MTAKRSVAIRGHRTSISLEAEFWQALEALAARREMPVAALVAEIDAAREASANLSSAIRIHLLTEARQGRLPAVNEPPSNSEGL